MCVYIYKTKYDRLKEVVIPFAAHFSFRPQMVQVAPKFRALSALCVEAGAWMSILESNLAFWQQTDCPDSCYSALRAKIEKNEDFARFLASTR